MSTKLFTGTGLCLGELKITGSDFPWVMGKLIPTQDYEQYKVLFEKEVALTNEIEELEDSSEGQMSSIATELEQLEEEKNAVEAEIKSLQLYTFNSETNVKTDMLTIHIDGDCFDYR